NGDGTAHKRSTSIANSYTVPLATVPYDTHSASLQSGPCSPESPLESCSEN
ncbi:hypothetical protein Pmar_PMAR029340, partial [Perkinsus marinus ATCC 50983]